MAHSRAWRMSHRRNRRLLSAKRRAARFLATMPWHAFKKMLKLHSSANNLFVYDPYSVSVREPEKGEFPWPLTWLLRTPSRKHMFQPATVPNIAALRKQLRQFTNR